MQRSSLGAQAQETCRRSQKEPPSEGEYRTLCEKRGGAVRVHGLGQEGPNRKQSWTQLRFQDHLEVGMGQHLTRRHRWHRGKAKQAILLRTSRAEPCLRKDTVG